MLCPSTRTARRGPPPLVVGSLVIGVLVASATALTTASNRQGTATPSASDEIAGQLLVATTTLRDPRFVQTVIYMFRHDARGAAGVVINLPLRAPSLTTLLKEWGIDETGSKDAAVYQGGPMESGRPFVVHTTDHTFEGTAVGESGIGVTASIDALRAIGAGTRPRHFLVTLGRAGWAPRQLEREMAADLWVVVPADEELVFDPDDEKKWDRAIAKGTRSSLYARR